MIRGGGVTHLLTHSPHVSPPSPAPPDTHICIELKKPNSSPCCRQPQAAGGTREGNILPLIWTLVGDQAVKLQSTFSVTWGQSITPVLFPKYLFF